MKPKVYIAGPYTKGDTIRNIANAIRYGDSLLMLGAIISTQCRNLV